MTLLLSGVILFYNSCVVSHDHICITDSCLDLDLEIVNIKKIPLVAVHLD